MDTFKAYQAQNLILLMGTNPLPNYVAGKLLMHLGDAKHPPTRLHLVVTNSLDPTSPTLPYHDNIAKRLIQQLAPEQKLDEIVINVGENAKPDDVYNKIKERVNKSSNESWGLNYTGGKKSMAANAYRGLRDALGGECEGYFSYLNAETLSMSIESTEAAGSTTITEPTLNHIKMSLAELLALHFQPDEVQKKLTESLKALKGEKSQIRMLSTAPTNVPFHPDFCRCYLDAWLSFPEEMDNWRSAILDHDLHTFVIETIKQRQNEEIVSFSTKVLKDQIRASWKKTDKDPFLEMSNTEFKKKERPKLRSQRSDQTSIPNIEGKWQGKTIAQLSKNWGEKPSAVATWLHGRWLEEIVLDAAKKISENKNLHISDYALSVDAKLNYLRQPDQVDKWDKNPGNFEGDILVLQGYRLFYITVTTSRDKGLNKSKLFEAFVRARQLGGDEAKVGLVTLYGNDSRKLEKEMVFPLGTSARVFGPEELSDLPKNLQNWIQLT